MYFCSSKSEQRRAGWIFWEIKGEYQPNILKTFYPFTAVVKPYLHSQGNGAKTYVVNLDRLLFYLSICKFKCMQAEIYIFCAAMYAKFVGILPT